MTTKANAHFVDCDIKSGQSAETWNYSGIVGRRNTALDWTTTRMADNGDVINLDSDYNVSTTNTISVGGAIAIDIDPFGNYIVGTLDDDEPVYYYDSTETKIDDFLQPTGGWNAVHNGVMDVVYGARFTYDGLHIYVLLKPTVAMQMWLLKFDAITGLQEGDTVTIAGLTPQCLAIDEDDNVYICPGGIGSTLYQYDSNLNLVTTYTKPLPGNWTPNARDMWVDDDLGYIFIVGQFYSSTLPTVYYQLWAINKNNTESWLFQTQNSSLYYLNSITVFNGFVYTVGTRTSGNLNVWKLDPDNGTILACYDTGVSETTFVHIDWLERIAVRSDEGLNGYIYLFDEDLVLLSKSAAFTSDQVFRADSVVLPRQEFNKLPYGGDVTSRSEQNRTVSYPLDYSHLNGETVQVLSNGIYVGDEVVADGQITLDDNAYVNHVGLKITSRLQPMKIDGEVKIKRIRHLIPDFHETVGGKYGREEDNLYPMELKATGDPMDRDGDLHTGYVELPFDGEYDRNGDIWIQQDIPLPMKLLAVGIKLSEEAI